MNYKKIALRTISEFAEANPDMTLGEIFYSILRPNMSGAQEIKDIRQINDEDFYSIVEKAKQFEQE